MTDFLPPLVAIVGTNASGKSELGVVLASIFHGEIVSADSRQVYRGLCLCSGKMPLEERQGIPHHLLDLVDVGEGFSLAQFQRLAYQVIDEILARRNMPILVGGTGLYVQAVIDGYELVQAPPNPALRAELAARPTRELAETLYSLDPDSRQYVEPHNKRRIIRALEIHYAGFSYPLTRRQNPRYETLRLGLTWPQEVLHERIDTRLRSRLKDGMVNEVRDLVNAGKSLQSIDALGLEYRYILRYLTGKYKTESEMYEELKTAIRQFARRQLSWYRRDNRIIWLDFSGNYFQEAERRISEWLRMRQKMTTSTT